MAREQVPAFQFYPKDFLSDGKQAAMSLCEVGAYIRLLSTCWLEHSIPDDVTRVARIVGATPREMAKLWPAVRACFQAHPSEPGRLVHGRLDRERAVQAEFRAKQQENGKLGGRPKRETQTEPNPNPDETQTLPKPNPDGTQQVTQPEPNTKPKKSSPSPSPSPEERGESPPARAHGAGSRNGLLAGLMPVDHGDCLAHGPICLKPRIARELLPLFNSDERALRAWAQEVCSRWLARVDAGEKLYTADAFRFWRTEYDATFGATPAISRAPDGPRVPDAAATAAYLAELRSGR
jgi:uncharacterized protein YdaU (DUF1376 family)